MDEVVVLVEFLIALLSLIAGWAITFAYFRISDQRQSIAFKRVEEAIAAIWRDEIIPVTPKMAADTIVTLLDYHESGMKVHLQRTATHARRVAEELNLDPTEVGRTEFAAYLCDVGRIGIDHEILSKSGPLTKQEWESIRNHPILGARIVESVDPRISTVIRHHHEHFDGTGYPDGLANGAIPIGARIILVVDAFEALTTERPYRHALPRESALLSLRQHAGSKFDPDIVGAFERALSVS